MISKLLSLHANHFMWFIAINPHNNLIKWVELSLLSYKKWGLSLKEVKYLAHSHASLAGAEPRKFESRTNTLEDCAEIFQMQGYQQRNALIHL